MYNIGRTQLARLRPEKLDDVALKKQISIIQEVCGDIDPDIIAIVFHECDYNIQNTISRLRTGDFEDGGWQTAKPNNKKKNHNNNVELTNGDNERNNSEPPVHPRSHEEILPTTSSSTDEYEFLGKTSQSLTFENSIKKSSSIPHQPVSMHPILRYSTEPIDIQFGDIKWNDSIPIVVTPSTSPSLIESGDEQQLSSIQNDSHEPATRLSTSPLSEATNPVTEEISHLSDQLDNSSQVQNQFVSNSSAFTPYNNSYQNPQTWYKTNPKPTGNYPQQTSYQLPPQQQYFLGTYPYPTPTLYPIMTPVDPYSTYPPTNYLSTYPTQPQYYKPDQYAYELSSQSPNDIPPASKLSATAASFSQATNPATTFYLNPLLYTLPTYYRSPQDRSIIYPSIDNRTGALYNNNNNNRNNYQRTQNNNSTWHSQQ